MSNYFLKLGLLLLFAIASSVSYFLTINSTENVTDLEKSKRDFVLKNAEIYAKDNGIILELLNTHERSLKIKSYADNFIK